MGIDIFNCNTDDIEKSPCRLVYIASPFAGDVDGNIEFARDACRFCIEEGSTPIAVHLLYPQILDDQDPEQRQIGLKLGHNILKRCDEIWVCGNTVSQGMSAEIVEAERLGIPIRQVTKEQIYSISVSDYSMTMC